MGSGQMALRARPHQWALIFSHGTSLNLVHGLVLVLLAVAYILYIQCLCVCMYILYVTYIDKTRHAVTTSMIFGNDIY